MHLRSLRQKIRRAAGDPHRISVGRRGDEQEGEARQKQSCFKGHHVVPPNQADNPTVALASNLKAARIDDSRLLVHRVDGTEPLKDAVSITAEAFL